MATSKAKLDSIRVAASELKSQQIREASQNLNQEPIEEQAESSFMESVLGVMEEGAKMSPFPSPLPAAVGLIRGISESEAVQKPLSLIPTAIQGAMAAGGTIGGAALGTPLGIPGVIGGAIIGGGLGSIGGTEIERRIKEINPNLLGIPPTEADFLLNAAIDIALPGGQALKPLFKRKITKVLSKLRPEILQKFEELFPSDLINEAKIIKKSGLITEKSPTKRLTERALGQEIPIEPSKGAFLSRESLEELNKPELIRRRATFVEEGEFKGETIQAVRTQLKLKKSFKAIKNRQDEAFNSLRSNLKEKTIPVKQSFVSRLQTFREKLDQIQLVDQADQGKKDDITEILDSIFKDAGFDVDKEVKISFDKLRQLKTKIAGSIRQIANIGFEGKQKVKFVNELDGVLRNHLKVQPNSSRLLNLLEEGNIQTIELRRKAFPFSAEKIASETPQKFFDKLFGDINETNRVIRVLKTEGFSIKEIRDVAIERLFTKNTNPSTGVMDFKVLRQQFENAKGLRSTFTAKQRDALTNLFNALGGITEELEGRASRAFTFRGGRGFFNVAGLSASLPVGVAPQRPVIAIELDKIIEKLMDKPQLLRTLADMVRKTPTQSFKEGKKLLAALQGVKVSILSLTRDGTLEDTGEEITIPPQRDQGSVFRRTGGI